MNRRFFCFSFIVPLFLIGTLCAKVEATVHFPTDNVDAIVEKTMSDWQIPGLALAIVQGDDIAYAKGYGVRQLGSSDTVDEHTVFAIASCTKAFTATALAMLIDEKKLQWDERAVFHYRKADIDFELYDPWITEDLTIRDMLSHRSGLRRCDSLWYGTSFDRREVLHRMRYIKPIADFRASWDYSNLMFLAAGELIPAITGISWDEFISSRLFAPLEMVDSSTSVNALEGHENIAMPHAEDGGATKILAWRNIDNIGPAASINSSAADMAKWLIFQLHRGSYKGKQLVSEEVFSEMHNPHALIQSDIMSPRKFLLYALGWYVEDYRGFIMLHHGGNIDGMTSIIAMIPTEGVGFVILTNKEGTRATDALVYALCDQYLEKKWSLERLDPLLMPAVSHFDWSERYLQMYREEEKQYQEWLQAHESERPVVTHVETSVLESYVGTYHSDLFGTLSITIIDDKLYAHFLAFEGALESYSDDVFALDTAKCLPISLGQIHLTFHANEQGICDRLDVSLEGKIDESFFLL